MRDHVLDYRAALAYNREVFLIERSSLVKAFSAIDGNFTELVEVLRTMRDPASKSYVSLIPFVLLLQRQGRAAFEAFSAFQSHQGWVVLRPGIEAVLIMGKFVDDPANAIVWQNRKQNGKTYQHVFSGPALTSMSLPGANSIRAVLSKINDDFVHPNPAYYDRHLEVAASDPGYVAFWLNYFDKDVLQEAHPLAFLNLLLVLQDALAGLFGAVFSVPIALRSPLTSFTSSYSERMGVLASQSEEANQILRELGLWK